MMRDDLLDLLRGWVRAHTELVARLMGPWIWIQVVGSGSKDITVRAEGRVAHRVAVGPR